MNKNTQKKLILSAIAFGLTHSSVVSTANAETTSMGTQGIECHGGNSCKGKGECGGPDGRACAGTNSCKGKGWITAKDQAACDAMISKVKKTEKSKNKKS